MIQLSVVDPMLYGTARAFEYLGFRGQDMLDRIGDGIIEYGLSEGYFEKSNDPHQFVGNIVKFFVKSGYMSNITIDQNGDTLDIVMQNYRFLPLMQKLRNRNSFLLTCPVCMANNAITKSVGVVNERISDSVTRDGIFSMKLKIAPGITHTESTVIPHSPADFTDTKLESQLDEGLGLPAFEAIAYGLACGFEYLGAQAQLILDNVGQGMLEFMRDESRMQLRDDLEGSLRTLSTFMVNGGLAHAIEIQLSRQKVIVDFKNYCYLPVLKRLLDNGRSLSSCPFTLAARAVIRNEGFAIGGMQWQVLTDGARLTMTMVNRDSEQFNESKVSSMMDQA